MKDFVNLKINSVILKKDISDMSKDELVQHVINFIRSEIYKYLINYNDIEDFEQDCIFYVLKYFNTIDKSKFPKAYIKKIINSTIINNLNRYYKNIKNERLYNDITLFENKFTTNYIDKSYMSVLNEREKQIFNLVFAGYTYKEIAQQLNVSKQRITQITDVMASKIKKYREEN